MPADALSVIRPGRASASPPSAQPAGAPDPSLKSNVLPPLVQVEVAPLVAAIATVHCGVVVVLVTLIRSELLPNVPVVVRQSTLVDVADIPTAGLATLTPLELTISTPKEPIINSNATICPRQSPVAPAVAVVE